MNEFDRYALAAAGIAALLLLAIVARLRRRRARARAQSSAPRETVSALTPQAVRVLSIHERKAYALLRHALPGVLVLAQVPLLRFLRVPATPDAADWHKRVGSLSADLLLCDSGSRVLAVVDIRAPHEDSSALRRHKRMTRALRAAGIRVHVWREGELPTVDEVREGLGRELAAAMNKPVAASSSRPAPLIPVAEIEELPLGEDWDAIEPVPSDFYDPGETGRGQLSKA